MNTRIWLELPADQIYNPVLRQGVEVNLEIAGFIRLHYVEVRQEMYANRRTDFRLFHFERRNTRWVAEMLRTFADWSMLSKRWIQSKFMSLCKIDLGLLRRIISVMVSATSICFPLACHLSGCLWQRCTA